MEDGQGMTPKHWWKTLPHKTIEISAEEIRKSAMLQEAIEVIKGVAVIAKEHGMSFDELDKAQEFLKKWGVK